MLAMVVMGSFFVSGAKSETFYICHDDSDTLSFTNIPGKDCEVLSNGKDGDSRYPGKGVSNKSEANTVTSELISGHGIQNNELNSIQNNAGLSHFLGQLSAPGRVAMNHVTVYHFGDSHVNSGVFPKSIARVLQQRFGDGGGSFCRLNKFDGNKSLKNVPSDSGDDANAGDLPQETCVPIGGDTESLLSVFTQGQGPQNIGLSYYAFGISGKTIDYFSRSRSMLYHLRKYRPDLVIITLGTNDAFARLDYEDILIHLDRLFSSIRSVSPTASILFTVPPDTFFRSGVNNNYTPIVRRAMIDFCRQNGCAWWDLYEIMGGAGSMNGFRERGLGSRDRIHFTSNGYRSTGESIAKAIIETFNRATVSGKR